MGRVVIPEPVNFEDGNGNIYERDSDSKGFLKTKSNSLEFHGKGADFLITQSVLKGISEDILLQRRIKSQDRVDERWKTVSETYLKGINKYDESKSETTVTTEASQGGIYAEIESKKDEELDIKGTTSITGDDIGELETVDLTITGREIFLESKLSVDDGTLIDVVIDDGLNARCIPFQVKQNSDQENITYVYGNQLSAASGNYANLSADKSANCFYTNSDQDRTLTLTGKVKVEMIGTPGGVAKMDLLFYEDGADLKYNNSRRIELVSTTVISTGQVMEYNFVDFIVDIKKGDSLTIGMLSETLVEDFQYKVLDTTITITEDSYYAPTICKCITPKAMGDRLVAMITGQRNIFRSSLFDDGGKYENHLITQGFYIRQFPDIVNEGTDEERSIPFNTSLNEFLENWDAIDPIAYWVEKEGSYEVFRVESLKYTQQNFVGVKYGITKDKFEYITASNVKRQDLEDNYYSSLKFGSVEGGSGYEEVYGLQSISGSASWTTYNTGTSIYSKISPWALGDVDVELPRRKSFITHPETDTKYDDIKNVIVCKKVNGEYYVKNWQEDFSEAPKNIYRPNSAFNLTLTPLDFLYNHSFVFNSGLYHSTTESIRGYSSNCNGSFTSRKIGGELLRQDEEVPHSKLEKPRIRPRSVDFNLKVDQEIEDMILGTTNGIPNWFGLVSVQTKNGIEYMRLVKVDTNKEGTHKLVEAYI